MGKKYKHLYFDLDRTLWDFETNSKEAFKTLFSEFNLKSFIPNADLLFLSYNEHNEDMWKLYRLGKIKKDFLRIERFILTLGDFGNSDKNLAQKLSEEYLRLAPKKPHLMRGCIETLDYLQGKYNLHIITNGFKEIQRIKMKHSGLSPYFNKIVTSDEAYVQKPNPGIFEYALKSVNAKKQESIMIGDDLEVDILGAKKMGMDQVFVNYNNIEHNHNITHEISELIALKKIL